MKKIFLTTILSLTIIHTAKAVDSTGCGLGSTIWKGERGVAPQVLAVTTNGTSGSQTLGIVTGTLGCDPNGRITGGTGKILGFLANNLDSFALDASKGEGETINVIASIVNQDVKKVQEVITNNFDELFSGEDLQAVEVSQKLAKLLNVA